MLKRAMLAGAVVVVAAGLGGTATGGFVSQLTATANLVSYWDLNEASGTNAADSVTGDPLDGNNPGAYSGAGVTVGQAGPRPSDGFYGFAVGNRAPDFAGIADQRLEMSPGGYGGNTDLSMLFWFQYDDLNPSGDHIGGIDRTGSARYVFSAHTYGGGIRFFAKRADATNVLAGDVPVAGNTDWRLLTAVFEGGDTARLYLDGQLIVQGTSGTSGGLYSGATDHMIFARDPEPTDARPLNGQLDEIATFNRALTSQEIKNLYQAAVNTPPVTPYGTNLIKNPGAETWIDPATQVTHTSQVPYSNFNDRVMDDWIDPTTPQGYVTNEPYDNVNSRPPSTQFPPATFGGNFFMGGSGTPLNMAITQSIKVHDRASAIDNNTVSYDLSGWFGGYMNDPDFAGLTATFKDGSGAPVGTAQIGVSSTSDWGAGTNVTLVPRATTGPVPAGTRTVDLELWFTKTSTAEYGNGMADNLALEFSRQTHFGVNLIENPSAEMWLDVDGPVTSPAPVDSGVNDRVLIGWTDTGNTLTNEQYGHSQHNAPSPTTYPPGTFGSNYFVGGNNVPASTGAALIQTIDVSDLDWAIDRDWAKFDLSGWFGGYYTQDDLANLTAVFKSVSDAVLGSAQIGVYASEDWGNTLDLVFRATKGYLPIGTRRIDLALNFELNAPTFCNGMADNLSLTLTRVPEPTTLGLLAFGGLGMLLRRRRTR